jgi:hypothetical protein
MRYEQAVDVAAPPSVPWSILLDVARWPEWTTSVTATERLDDGELAVGSRTRVRQPGLRPAVWVVTELTAPTSRTPGSFVWVSSMPGIVTTASHTVLSADGSASRIVLGIEQDGVLARLVAVFFGARTRRYLATETAGLRARSLERA